MSLCLAPVRSHLTAWCRPTAWEDSHGREHASPSSFTLPRLQGEAALQPGTILQLEVVTGGSMHHPLPSPCPACRAKPACSLEKGYGRERTFPFLRSAMHAGRSRLVARGCLATRRKPRAGVRPSLSPLCHACRAEPPHSLQPSNHSQGGGCRQLSFRLGARLPLPPLRHA